MRHVKILMSGLGTPLPASPERASTLPAAKHIQRFDRHPKKHTSAARRSVSYSRVRLSGLPAYIAFGLDARFDGPHYQRLCAIQLSVNTRYPRIMIERELQLSAGEIPEREFPVLPHFDRPIAQYAGCWLSRFCGCLRRAAFDRRLRSGGLGSIGGLLHCLGR